MAHQWCPKWKLSVVPGVGWDHFLAWLAWTIMIGSHPNSKGSGIYGREEGKLYLKSRCTSHQPRLRTGTAQRGSPFFTRLSPTCEEPRANSVQFDDFEFGVCLLLRISALELIFKKKSKAFRFANEISSTKVTLWNNAINRMNIQKFDFIWT